MRAQTIPGAIVLDAVYVLDGDVILETGCRDFDHYITLPTAVQYDGRICGKTGWSSDTHKACYKSSAKVALPPTI
jgi:hypothetical protein